MSHASKKRFVQVNHSYFTKTEFVIMGDEERRKGNITEAKKYYNEALDGFVTLDVVEKIQTLLKCAVLFDEFDLQSEDVKEMFAKNEKVSKAAFYNFGEIQRCLNFLKTAQKECFKCVDSNFAPQIIAEINATINTLSGYSMFFGQSWQFPTETQLQTALRKTRERFAIRTKTQTKRKSKK